MTRQTETEAWLATASSKKLDAPTRLDGPATQCGGRIEAVDSTSGRNILEATQVEGMLQTKQKPRIYYTENQKALMWERWRKGESLQRIARLFDRNRSLIRRILAEAGGTHCKA